MKLKRSFDAFVKNLGLWYVNDFNADHGTIPCYATRWTVTNVFDTKGKIIEYIEHVRREHVNGLEIFSVTERDAHHKLWLQVIQEKYWNQHGARIMETTSRLRGDYVCWLIMVPNATKEERK